jgi:hypothetical protein
LHWRAGGANDLHTVLIQCSDHRRYVGWGFGRRRRLHRLSRLAGLRGPEELFETAGRDENEHANHVGIEGVLLV